MRWQYEGINLKYKKLDNIDGITGTSYSILILLRLPHGEFLTADILIHKELPLNFELTTANAAQQWFPNCGW
jgi:hypothetical protein